MGAGKSEALGVLVELGAAVLSSDAVVHEQYATPALRDAVVARWGPEVAPGGVVDRAAVARHAFADPQERAWLEATLWPLVGAQMVAWRRQQEQTDPPPRALVVEVPLLFEAGMEGAFDTTIAVVADERVRARRLGERGQAALSQRGERQLSQADKAARAAIVVENSGTREQLRRALSAALVKLER